MPIPVSTDLDFQSVNRPVNLPASVAAGQPVVHEQLQSAIEGLAFKDNVRVKTNTNIDLAAPGAVLDGVTMVVGDRWAPSGQTAGAENGIYIWTGAATAATRAPDASTFDELESAIVTVDEGASAGTTWRQSAVNGTLGTTSITWVAFGTGTPAATESVAGAAKIATQAITDAGTNDADFLTPLKALTAAWTTKSKKFTIGDASATSFTLTHNFNTRDLGFVIKEATGLERDIIAEVDRNGAGTSLNATVIKMTPAPALNSVVVYVTKLGIAP